MLICVTNRHLCEGDFLTQIRRITAAKPTAVLLREKDLSPTAYRELVEAVTPIVAGYGVPLWSYLPPPTGNTDAKWHLPYPQFTALLGENSGAISADPFGVSVHATAEAELATRHGAGYLIAGHIFPTDCKQGVPGRGLCFLREIVTATAVVSPCDAPPIYAIGGITPEHCRDVRRTGVAGVCVMSALMKSTDPGALIADYQSHWESC